MRNYHDVLKIKMNQYVHNVYRLARSFPKEELFASSSQLRRSSLSIILNFIEGYARRRIAVKLNFWEIAYGSLKESKYLIEFAYEEGWINKDAFELSVAQIDEVGAMLLSAIQSIYNKQKPDSR